ncbi:arsenate reductase (glutaredoxin) [Pantoea sp. KPR_PJ]|uniref:arsenate reductase (glutaredoxin) n=1 Tax=Pantoea sp. KPR_PJ TaxID=2738375 RepID=UPI003529C475
MVTIYHNPRCSKSRETLSLLEKHGIAPDIVRYLDTPPTRETLQILLQKLNMSSVRQLMRIKEDLYRELQLEQASESELLDALAAHPKLLERPIVINGAQARLGRPPEAVLEIL